MTVSEELANIFSAAERLIDQLDNPLHIAIMENYRMHAMLEYCGRFEELLAPRDDDRAPRVPNLHSTDGIPCLRRHGRGAQRVLRTACGARSDGADQRAGAPRRQRLGGILPGTVRAPASAGGRAARTKGHDIDDRDLDGYFIEDHWTSMYFIYNDEARLIGEHIYHSPATDLREITVDEFYDLEQLRAVLEPKIAAGPPHRRLSVGERLVSETIFLSDIPTFFSAEVAADPYAFYRRLRAEAPVHYDHDLNGYLISRHADVAKGGYRDPIFSSRSYERIIEPVFGRSLLQMDGKRACAQARAGDSLLPR